MTVLPRVVAIVALGSSLVALGGVAVPAGADTPVGTCTASYGLYDSAQLAFDPGAQAIFSVIDSNHDGFVCFKAYPNGPHNGHDGNLVDDKAAPHS